MVRRHSVLRRSAATFTVALVASSFAHAAPQPTSRYTNFDLKPPTCRENRGPAEGSTCKGEGGWTVLVGFPAFGASVAVAGPGRGESRELSARDGRSLVVDGLSPSQSPIEWRGTMRAGRFEPNAAILRVQVLDAAQRQDAIESGRAPANARRAQVLIVYRLGPAGVACQVAYVDAGANPNANELARAAADSGTTCPVDRVAVPGRTSPIFDSAIR